MAVNSFFAQKKTQNEWNLEEDLYIELVQIKGFDAIYFPRVLLAVDDVLNEVVHSYHSRGIMIEMIITQYDDWENNSMAFGAFGLQQLPSTVRLEVSRKRFEEEVAESRLEFPGRPNEGDLIYLPEIKEFFKIKKVNVDNPLVNQYKWILLCEMYRDANAVNIDMTDYVSTEGTFDPNYDNFKHQEYIPVNEDIEQYIQQVRDAGEKVIPQEELLHMNAYEIDAKNTLDDIDETRKEKMDNLAEETGFADNTAFLKISQRNTWEEEE